MDKNLKMATNNWVLDPAHREVQFKIRLLMITNVTGSFNSFEAHAITNRVYAFIFSARLVVFSFAFNIF